MEIGDKMLRITDLCKEDDSKQLIYKYYWVISGVEKLHNEKGPAYETKAGDKYWYQFGVRHRDIEPAIEYRIGDKEWWHRGQPHRDNDLPAAIYKTGKMWFYQGYRHRAIGPAVEYTNGDYEYFVMGKRHRLDGFAVMINGKGSYYIDGKHFSENDFLIKIGKEDLINFK